VVVLVVVDLVVAHLLQARVVTVPLAKGHVVETVAMGHLITTVVAVVAQLVRVCQGHSRQPVTAAPGLSRTLLVLEKCMVLVVALVRLVRMFLAWLVTVAVTARTNRRMLESDTQD
jgi:hypothetical protein